MPECADTGRQALLMFQRALVCELATGRHGTAASGSVPAALAGMSSERISLMARLAHAKRMGKIARVMPASVELAATLMPQFIDAFGAEHPLRDAGSYPSAVQFYRFVRRCCRRGSLGAAYLADLARCELALAAVTRRATARPVAPGRSRVLVRSVQRNREAIFRVLEHDVMRVLRSPRPWCADVPARRTFVVIVPGSDGQVRLLELPEPLFRWARRLRTAAAVRRASTTSDGWALVESLLERGVLEAPVGQPARGRPDLE